MMMVNVTETLQKEALRSSPYLVPICAIMPENNVALYFTLIFSLKHGRL